MAYTSEPDLLVMHAVRLKGFAECEQIVEATGLAEDVTIDILNGFHADGTVTRREGRISGWALTPGGRERHRKRLLDERDAAACTEVLDRGYEGFLCCNESFKQLCTDWQLRIVGGDLVANDHTDTGYDGAIGGRLQELHLEVLPVLEALSSALERFGTYPDRLGAANERFRKGQREALVRPLSGSYHDVWMELHQDLLLTLDRERAEADGT
jgi:hypothetical protein